MALERFHRPSFNDVFFFDDMFEDMDRQIARMHHDMRNAMVRLTPLQPIAASNDKHEQQLAEIRDPVVVEKDGSRRLDLSLDLSSFKPEEIEVKTKNNVMTVAAKHEEKTENSRVYREFHREFTLPEGTDVEQLKSTMSKDGVLCIKGPIAEQSGEEKIPIEQSKE